MGAGRDVASHRRSASEQRRHGDATEHLGGKEAHGGDHYRVIGIEENTAGVF